MRKKVSFNPNAYRHLDTAPLYVWRREFAVRHPGFSRDLAGIEKTEDPDKRDRLENEFYIKYGVIYDEMEDGNGMSQLVSFPPFGIEYIDLPESRAQREKNIQKSKLGIDDASYYPLYHEIDDFNDPGILGRLLPAEWNLLSDEEKSDFLFIRLHRRMDRKRAVTIFRKLLSAFDVGLPEGGRKRLSTWKEMLMVYDLVKKGLLFEKVSEVLCEAFPEKEDKYLDENTIGRYYRKARDLVRGGYRQYL